MIFGERKKPDTVASTPAPVVSGAVAEEKKVVETPKNEPTISVESDEYQLKIDIPTYREYKNKFDQLQDIQKRYMQAHLDWDIGRYWVLQREKQKIYENIPTINWNRPRAKINMVLCVSQYASRFIYLRPQNWVKEIDWRKDLEQTQKECSDILNKIKVYNNL